MITYLSFFIFIPFAKNPFHKNINFADRRRNFKKLFSYFFIIYFFYIFFYIRRLLCLPMLFSSHAMKNTRSPLWHSPDAPRTLPAFYKFDINTSYAAYCSPYLIFHGKTAIRSRENHEQSHSLRHHHEGRG